MRCGHLELIALAAHRLDQNGQVHLAAARDVKGVGAHLCHMQRDILEQFSLQTVAQVAGRDVFALAARERRIVDGEGHFDGRVRDLDERQRLDGFQIAERAADGDIRNAGEGDDLAGRCLLDGAAAKAGKLVQGDDLFLLLDGRVVVIADDDLLVLVDRAAFDAADAHTANEFVIVDGRDEHLQRPVFIALRRIDIVDDRLEQRDKIRALVVRTVGRRALTGRAEDRRGIELFLGRIQIEQQLKHLVHDLMHTGVRPVDLVDDNDDLVAKLQRLLQHEARLRHGSLRCVDKQQNAVDHLQNALDLAGEIGMARGIDDVDLIILIVDSGILGENGDAALAFEIAGVHHTVDDRLVFAVHAALLEHLIDQRGLAVVNVRDDCNIPNFILRHTWRPFLLCLKVSYIKISQKRILTQTYWKYKIFL